MRRERSQRAEDYAAELDAMRPVIRERSKGLCEASLPCCTKRAEHVHHRRLRSQGGGNDADNLVDLCLACHARIHAHPAESYESGLLVRMGAK